ncbi:MAG: extracellular solute-binding protein family 1 [Paenibacillus sp.]|nr:extracellular solute-binding protein family 1 [Paenibacillus sp.]
MNKAKFALVMLAFLQVFAQGCSGGKSAAPTGGEDAAGKPAEPAPPVELVFHGTKTSQTEEFFMQNFGNFINKKFPNVKLKYFPTTAQIGTKQLLAAGEKIDVMLVSAGSISQMVLDNNLQYDITPLVQKYKYDLTRLAPATIELEKSFGNGAIYGLPYATDTLALFYNKSLFDKFGAAYLTNNTSWDDVYNLAQKLTRTENGVQYRGFTVQYQHILMLNQLAVPYQDAKTAKSLLTGDAFTKEMDFVTRMIKIPGNSWDKNPSAAEFVGSFANETSAMFAGLVGAWFAYQFKQPGWDIVKLPQRKEAPNVGPQLYPDYLMLTNMSKNPDAAFQVISSFTTEEYQQQSVRNGWLPILKDGNKLMGQYAADVKEYGDFSKRNKDFLWTTTASIPAKSKYDAIGLKYMNQAYLDIITSRKDLNSALRDAAEASDKEIAATEGK